MHTGHRLLPILVLVLLGLFAAPVAAADPGGVTTLEENPGAALDFIWILICGFMVMFMQAGFSLVETGFTRAKNAANIMMKNLMDFSVGALSYWAVGFAVMYGTAGTLSWLFGWSGFFLIGDAYDVSTIASWFFQMVFAATAATIVSGAVAERCKFSTYVIASIMITALIYPIYGHWLWGGGWLADLGALDFAGSGVVHALGGWLALAAAMLLGPRIGKYGPDGTLKAIPGHSVTLGVLGIFVLWFGWYGFNCGSTLAADQLRISVIAANTTLAAAAALVTAMIITWAWQKKPDVSISGNAAIGGLVAITAGCAWVSPQASVLIGAVGGAVVVFGVWFLDHVLRVDDPVGVVPVHGFNGAWGLLALGIFADGTYGGVTGLLYGNMGFFVVQAVSVAVNFAWAFGTGLALFGLLRVVVGIRVSGTEELEGLDRGEHGTTAYPYFVVTDPAKEVDG
ncbi:ammonium transporter [Methanofollis aquaemaris]|uniref:Ammonium transporter n=1 Tax=Methanofollis aquaemaris TaxID=126734 RepID=A0A8A3S5A2_9EURY|nr:ammonium transporter [Methanofollis aquaemaris]QSZ66880.1 ammonium transporter [Methanofollis aquaemaris]